MNLSMNDSRASDSFRHKGREMFATSVLAVFLFVGLLAPAAGEPEGSDPANATDFDYHCIKRYCQFWLTDSSLMLRSGLRFEWEFGDGQSSTKPAPLHFYERDGRFEPVLTVYDHDDGQLLASSTDLLLGFDQNSLVSEIGGAFTGPVGMLSGTSVAGLGDFNGDGLGDLLVGAPDFFGQNRGRAHIAFGRSFASGATIDLTALDGTDGFAFLAGDTVLSSVGFSGARLGSIATGVNRAAAIGAPGNSTSGQTFFNRGYVAVLYPSPSGFPAQVTALDLDGNNGFLIEGPIEEAFGFSVAAAGDFNNDGFEDILIGAPQAPLDSSPLNRGETYVIYGSGGGFPSILSTFGLAEDEAFVFEGIIDDDRSGWSVDGIGDFNGDGIDDIVIGAPTADDFIFIVQDSPTSDLSEAEGVGVEGTIGLLPGPGAAYVIYGGQADLLATGRAPLDDNLLDGVGGFTIRTDPDDMIGWSVAGVGDLNGNGAGDLAVSAPLAPNPAEFVSGAVYVLFGGGAAPFESDFNPATGLDGTNGFALTGLFQGLEAEFSGDRSISLASAGDINGDGFDDLVVGLPGVSGDAGVAFVIFGRDGGFPPQIDLTNLDPADGFMIVPEVAGFQLGASVAGLGDFDGDGQDDMALGAPGNTDAPGVAWVVPGQITASEPLINGGDGIADQMAAFTSVFEIEFEISDVLDPPQDLIVQAFSGDPGFLPDQALTLSGEGALRTLAIDTSQAAPGTVAISILVTNTFDLTGTAEFLLQIVEQPPVINDGAGIPEQTVFAGQPVEVSFTVSDLQDDPADILVSASSLTPNLIPPEGVSVTGTGETRTLSVQTIAGEGGVGQVNVEAVNSFGLSTVEEVSIVIDDTPVPIINDGGGIDDREVVAGDSLSIDFEVEDPEFGPQDIDVSAISGSETVLPSEQLTIVGDGVTRTLVIETLAGNIGSTPITIEASNPLGGTDEVTFMLTITAAPPAVNDGEPIDDAEVQAGDALMVDFRVSDPVDPAELLEITVESSNTELVPLDAITVTGTGDERTLVIETRPGTQGESLITVTVTNTNGQVDVREFLVEVFLLPTMLNLSLDAFGLPAFPDLLVRLSAANTGEETAFSVLLAAEIPEPFEAVGVFVESQNCVLADGAVSCEVESLPAWECALFEGTLVCELEALQPEHEAGVILRVQGSGQAELTALLNALNASDVAAEVELEF